LAFSLFASSPGHSQERFRAGYSGISGYQVGLWLAVDLGLFKKYGLTVEPVLFRGGSESSLALTTGEIQFDVVAPSPHIAADLSGADIIIIGTYFKSTLTASLSGPAFVPRRNFAAKRSEFFLPSD